MADTFLKQRREELGYSQSQFAELSGINYRTLQEYEQGRKSLGSVKGESLVKISKSLGCTLEELLLENEPNPIRQKSRLKRYLYLIDESLFQKHSRIINTPFDDVFRTLSVDCPSLLIPVINLAFGENHPLDTSIVHGQNEHLMHGNDGATKKRITDANLFVMSEHDRKILYQIECQSRYDSSIILRMFEYASMSAIEGSTIEDNKLKISFPKSALIYLRHNTKTAAEMEIELDTPAGIVTWKVPILKTQLYSIDEIFEKKLYFFIPFYLLVYEKYLWRIEHEEENLARLKQTYSIMLGRLEEEVQKGELDSYTFLTIKNMSRKVVEHMTKDFYRIGMEVAELMGGEVLEYEAKDIKREGIREGIKEGRKEGRIEGIREGMLEAIRNLMDSMSISADEAMRLVNIPEAEYGEYREMLGY